ncbi:hypothetical protein VPH35_088827 [Triticum aestivum]
MSSADVIPLLGGVAEVLLSSSLGVGLLSPGESLDSVQGRHDGASSTSSLCWEHRVWGHGLEVLHCAPPVFAAVHDGSSAAQCTVVASDSKTAPFSGLIESHHTLATSFRHKGWMERRQGKLGRSYGSSEVTGVG